ncbi:hypothetical protein WBG78_05410 [Chryseolinea sp. T2]|uniref:LVIVD repeat-containing protein n=1 Tax=Chryseolinea sp. T2 TaxID=3129255 RepID=UPI003077DAA7
MKRVIGIHSLVNSVAIFFRRHSSFLASATFMIIFILVIVSGCSEDGAEANLTGKGGSLARFATSPTHLYAVDNEELHVYQFMDGGAISRVNKVSLGPGVETIAAMGDRLYIGTNEAMIILDISSPSNPILMSQHSHFVGCDPVVVQDTLAFVTLRTTSCRPSSVNILEVVDVKDVRQPLLVSSYALESPYGLGIDGDLLFVCEGENGLKVFNVTDPKNLQLLKDYQDVDAYDVITKSGLLVLTGKNGIIQYDYTDRNNIRKLSTIAIQ